MTYASNKIFPDKHNGVWGFDDPNDGLAWEPFVEGPDKMIHRAVADIPNAASAPGYFLAMGTIGLTHEDGGGNWYRSEQSCFIIARDLRSLAPSRASTCKTSWIDRSLF